MHAISSPALLNDKTSITVTPVKSGLIAHRPEKRLYLSPEQVQGLVHRFGVPAQPLPFQGVPVGVAKKMAEF